MLAVDRVDRVRAARARSSAPRRSPSLQGSAVRSRPCPFRREHCVASEARGAAQGGARAGPAEKPANPLKKLAQGSRTRPGGANPRAPDFLALAGGYRRGRRAAPRRLAAGAATRRQAPRNPGPLGFLAGRAADQAGASAGRYAPRGSPQHRCPGTPRPGRSSPLNSLATKLILLRVRLDLRHGAGGELDLDPVDPHLPEPADRPAVPGALTRRGRGRARLAGRRPGRDRQSRERRRTASSSARARRRLAARERRATLEAASPRGWLDWSLETRQAAAASRRATRLAARVTAQLASAQRRSKYFDAFVLVGGDASVRRVVGEPAASRRAASAASGVDRTVLRVLSPDSARMLVAATPCPRRRRRLRRAGRRRQASRIPSLLARSGP